MGSEEVSLLGGLKRKWHEHRGRSLANRAHVNPLLLERIMLYHFARKHLGLAGWDDKKISALFDIA